MEPQPRCDGQPEHAVPLEPVAGVAHDSQHPASPGHPGVESCGTVEGATLTAQPATPPEDPDEPEKNKYEGPEEYCLGVPQQAHGVTVLGRLPPPVGRTATGPGPPRARRERQATRRTARTWACARRKCRRTSSLLSPPSRAFCASRNSCSASLSEISCAN